MDEIRPINGVVKQPNPVIEEIKGIVMVVIATLLYSITTYMFVLPNDFAPSGLSGILAFVSYITEDLNTGTFTLLFLNLPLLILAFFYLSKRFAIRTTISVFVMCGSLFLLGLLDRDGKLQFVGLTLSGESDFGKKLFASLISGVCAGISIALNFRHASSLGGVDILVNCIQKKKPRANVSFLLFGFNAAIILVSCFIYPKGDWIIPESAFFSIIYVMVFSKVTEYVMNGVKKALKFEVVTEHPDELARELIDKLGHSVTVTNAKGMYANKEKYLLICVIRNNQVADFEKVLKKYPDTFAFASSVSEVFGVFFK
ncbi:MAG: YitT family protein [Clostridia bacterium]|nr:YitT family protein [Clostridia bacterium]